MLNCKFFQKKEGNFTDLTETTLLPIEFTLRIDKELDGGDISFKAYEIGTEDSLSAVNTLYRIAITDNNSGSISLPFLGTDSRAKQRSAIADGMLVSKSNCALFKHRVTLTEPTKALQGSLIDGFAVAQPEETSNRKTLFNVVSRLLAVTNLRRRSRQQRFVLTSDTATVNILKNAHAPEFKWSVQTTLWECLLDIASVIDAIPRLLPNADGTLYNTLTFDFVNEFQQTANSIEDGDTISIGESIDETQHSSALNSFVENILED